MTPNLKDLAKVGAQARLAAIQEEQAALLAMFPELRDGRARRKTATVARVAPSPKTRKRPPMSAAQKKAVGDRMKKYWAARRAAKANGAADAAAGNGAAVHGTSHKPRVGRRQGRKK